MRVWRGAKPKEDKMLNQDNRLELFNIFQMAERLRVPASTLYYWVGRNQIPFVKVGRHLRFDPLCVVEYFAEKTREASPTCLSARVKENTRLSFSLIQGGRGQSDKTR